MTGQSSVQSDLFAFGVILYELVSGRHPFVRPDAEELQSVRAIQFADPPPLQECCPEVPDELASVIDPLPEEESGGPLCVGRGCARGAEDDHAHQAVRDRHRCPFDAAGECAAGGAGEAVDRLAVDAGGALSRVGG